MLPRHTLPVRYRWRQSFHRVRGQEEVLICNGFRQTLLDEEQQTLIRAGEITGYTGENREAVEHLGYSYLTAIEHILGADLANRPNWEGRNLMCDFHEPFVLFDYLSGLICRLEFATNVLVLPQRQTALIAKQAASSG